MRRTKAVFAGAICLLGALCLSSATGCRSGNPWSFLPQGTISHQQSDAIVHDPYPMTDIAPDDNATRPRDFQNPLPEPVRNRIVPSTQIWTGRP
jgi:hypothetical protein